MISRIEINGMGPHKKQTIEFDPDGVTLVTGKSEAGKSTLVMAAAFVFWNLAPNGRKFPIDSIHDDCDKADVRIWLSSGTCLQHTLTRGGSHTRRIEKNGETRSIGTAAAWADEIGFLGEKVLRLVLVPGAWQELTGGDGDGRKLRNALDQILPESDTPAIIARLMSEAGFEFDPIDDPTLEKPAEMKRRKHKIKVGDCEGSLRMAVTHLAQTESQKPTAPSKGDVKRAEKITSTANSWKEWSLRNDRHADYTAKRAKLATWQSSRDELGECPEDPDHSDLEKAASDADEALKIVRDEHLAILGKISKAESSTADPIPRPPQDLEEALSDAMAEFRAIKKAYDALDDGDNCPQCDQPWAAMEIHRVAAEEKLAKAKTQGTAARAAVEDWKDAAVANATAANVKNEAALVDLRTELDAVEGRQITVRRRLADADAAISELGDSPAEIWHRSIHRLGDPPNVSGEPDAPGAEPKQWTQQEVQQARETVRKSDRADGAIEHHKRLVKDAKAAHDSAKEILEDARTEARRLEALVVAVRKAPTEAIIEQRGCLGDLGPVELRFDDGAKGGVQVLIDGRLWWTASRGRRVVADMWLRAGLRRARGIDMFPLFVDDVQNVGGQDLPEVEAPAILIRTTDGPFEVSHG